MSGLVVDDLDPGFTVETDDDVAAGEGLWGLYRTEMEFDQGLPRHWWYLEERLGGAWSREEVYLELGQVSAHDGARRTGRRKTARGVHNGIAECGHLALGIPHPDCSRAADARHGRCLAHPFRVFSVVTTCGCVPAEGDTGIEFDGSGAAGGWNKLGEFDIKSPQVSVVVSNHTDGDAVIADAIRWLQSTPGPASRPAGNNEP